MAERKDSADPDRDSTTVGRAGQRTATEGVISLSPEECWARLRTHSFGRLAIIVEGGPRIFPINYGAGADAIIFRTEPGAKLQHGPGSWVCLEIDEYDASASTGWSVMAVGMLKDISEDDDARGGVAVSPLAPGRRDRWLALRPAEVSGRYFRGGWALPS